MSEIVKQALLELKEKLYRLYGDRLVAVVLYGSVARGEEGEGSDVDVAVVLSGDIQIGVEIDRMSPLVSEIGLRYDITLSVLPIPEIWWRERQSPLLLNLRKEGVTL